MGKLLTMAEAADELRICERTLREHVRQGDIAYIAIGRGTHRRRRMFDQDDLTDFKERQRRRDKCLSTNTKTHRTTITTSNIKVVALPVQRAARAAAKPKSSSGRKSGPRAARKWIGLPENPTPTSP
ncbi:helix-turn-helix domain-containing protein [Microvirga sp. BT350]|uniref:Helix-turn-helix domain-containing protein n=1 Tax=Microvirga alba TaxID=2791025 RepID=A0A931BMI4_9HYPH|nr:helix-turn-helix domain-containing protein [Microvirga alba]